MNLRKIILFTSLFLLSGCASSTVVFPHNKTTDVEYATNPSVMRVVYYVFGQSPTEILSKLSKMKDSVGSNVMVEGRIEKIAKDAYAGRFVIQYSAKTFQLDEGVEPENKQKEMF